MSKVVAGPRDSDYTPAIESGIVDRGTDRLGTETVDDEVVGEFDDNEIDDDLPRFQPQRERDSDSVVDVEIVNPEGYTDVIMSDHPTTPGQDDSLFSGQLGASVGPLGLGGPAGSGLMSLEQANEAAIEMRAREAARIANMRRR